MEWEYPTSIPKPLPKKAMIVKPGDSTAELHQDLALEMFQEMCRDLFEEWSDGTGPDTQDIMTGAKFKEFLPLCFAK